VRNFEFQHPERVMKVWKVAKLTAICILAALICGGVLICRRIGRITAADNEMRCADLARGKALTATLDSAISHSDKCPTRELKALCQAASVGRRAEWQLNVDSNNCRYTLHTYSAAAWPIRIAVHLAYRSQRSEWEFICDGDRLNIKCP
jgi:hypothetical protein